MRVYACSDRLRHMSRNYCVLFVLQQLLEAIEKDNAAAMVKKKRRHKDKDRERRTSGASVLPLTKSTSFPGGIGGALDELDDARTPDKPLLIPTELSTSSMMSTGSALDGDVSAPPSTRVGSKVCACVRALCARHLNIHCYALYRWSLKA